MRPTPMELVATWAGQRRQVTRYEKVAVPGYELFWVQGTAEDTRRSAYAVAIPVDEQNFLEGKSALRALFQVGIDDPLDQARLSLLFLERGGMPLEGPVSDLHREIGVTPPQIVNGVLTYWYEQYAQTYVETLRAELRLSDLQLRRESRHLQEHEHP